MKKLYCLLVTAFLALTVFAEGGYKCNPTYEVYRDTCYYQMTNGKYITRDTDSVIKKGAEISGQTSYWYLKDPKASKPTNRSSRVRYNQLLCGRPLLGAHFGEKNEKKYNSCIFADFSIFYIFPRN